MNWKLVVKTKEYSVGIIYSNEEQATNYILEIYRMLGTEECLYLKGNKFLNLSWLKEPSYVRSILIRKEDFESVYLIEV